MRIRCDEDKDRIVKKKKTQKLFSYLRLILLTSVIDVKTTVTDFIISRTN